MSGLVYLAGPITGLTYKNCTDWRHYAIEKLRPITGLSPMRAKDYLSAVGSISGTGEEYAHMGPLSLPRGVITRDHFDCTRCDVLLVNFLGAERVSIGTVAEMAWAFHKRTPIVCAMEPQGNPHEHMFTAEMIGYRVDSLDQAIHICRAILLESPL